MQIAVAGTIEYPLEAQVIHTPKDLMALVRDQEVDLILLSEDFDASSWIGDQVQALCSAAPLMQIIVVGQSAEGTLIFELLEAGARGYLCVGDEPATHLEAALRSIQNGKIYLSPTANAEYLKATQSGCWECWLTPQTRTVLKFIAEGKTVAAIADLMRIKMWTVYKLLKRIRHRFDVTTNAAAISRAMALGYIRLQLERPQ